MSVPSPTSPPEAILFDMDGVLVHSFEAWVECCRAGARTWGLPEPSRATMRSIFGQGVDADAENLFPGRTPAEIARFYEERFPDHLDAIEVEPGAPETLIALGTAGVRTAVVTNTPTALAADILSLLGLAADELVGAEPHLQAKPAPDMVMEACRRLGVPPAAALMVGDSRYDHEAARAAGVPFAAYRMPLASGAPPPEHALQSMADLRDLLARG